MPGITDNDDCKVKRSRMELRGADVRDIFEPIFKAVIKHVVSQIHASLKPIKAVLLVGGFGENPYLRDEIAKEVTRVSPGTDVIQPPNGFVSL